MKLKDQVAIVTGTGRNIGEDTAKLLAQEGARVAVVDMDKARGDKVAADIVKAGGTAAGFVADVASEADVARSPFETPAARAPQGEDGREGPRHEAQCNHAGRASGRSDTASGGGT